MNIDDFKEAWQQDEPQDTKLPVSIELSYKTNSVVGRLRRNMRSELIALVVCYVIIGWWLSLGHRSPLWFNISCILLICMVALTCFYYLRFYVFYKNVARYDASMRSSIRKMVYNLELNTEIYRTYSFTTMPLAVFTSLSMLASSTRPAYLNTLALNGYLSWQALLIIVAAMAISFGIAYLIVQYHVRSQYGKYLEELKGVMNDLGEEY